MKHQGRYQAYPAAAAPQASTLYPAGHLPPIYRQTDGPQVSSIHPRTSHIRTSGLAVKKQSRTMKIDQSSGRVIKNQFAQRSHLGDYGIMSRFFCAGVIQSEGGSQASLFRVLEDTIDCETQADNTIIDVYFSWDGMLGSTSENGGSAFNFSLILSYGDELKILSRADAINHLGAKTCNGRSGLKDNRIPRKGTRVALIIHREIRLHTGPGALSEIHFGKPEDNYFKIITRPYT